jgi:hypothetical protein
VTTANEPWVCPWGICNHQQAQECRAEMRHSKGCGGRFPDNGHREVRVRSDEWYGSRGAFERWLPSQILNFGQPTHFEIWHAGVEWAMRRARDRSAKHQDAQRLGPEGAEPGPQDAPTNTDAPKNNHAESKTPAAGGA